MIRARFAPSPTGFLHLGGARTALFNWAFINHFRQQGQEAEFLLRIEDTDVDRSTQAATDAIFQAMAWLGLDYQGEVVYQTKRLARYQEVADKMIAKGLAYRCYASKEELEALREAQKARGEKPRYDRRWRQSDKTPPIGITPVIRFANPELGVVHWQDLIKGAIAIDNAELDDFVIMRADGVPTYNFANVVDDSDQAITHVIRGDDHVNNTPKQINIYRALALPEPQFGHLPMIHGDDGEKLSKRHGAVNVMEYQQQGFLPSALLNYLARLGFSHGNDEIFSMSQLAEWFDWSHVQSSPARFDGQKLLWLNQQYIIKTPINRLHELITQTPLAEDIEIAAKNVNVAILMELYKDRCQTILELAQELANFKYLPQIPTIPADLQADINNAKDIFLYLAEAFKNINDEAWSAEKIHETFQNCLKATSKKMGQLGVPLRIALLGKKQSPAIDKILAAMNRQVVINVLEGLS